MRARCPIDYADPDLYAADCPYERLAAAAPDEVKTSSAYTPVLRYDAVRTVSKRHDLFSSQEQTILVRTPRGDELKTQRNFLLNMDEPRHGRVRRIVAEAFSVRAIDARSDAIAAIVEAEADKIVASQTLEFVGGFATPVTLGVILMVMGVDRDDLEFLRRCTEEVVYTDDPRFNPTGKEGARAAIALFTYAMQLYRKLDTHGDGSVLRKLCEGLGGSRLSQEEFCFFFVFILAAGYETTRSMLCNMMTILAERPEVLPALRTDRGGLDAIVDEMLRFDPPVIQMCRAAMADAELSTHIVRQGDKLGLVYPMANRDDRVFEDPHRFSPARENAAQHLSFGTGRHKCLGSHLARVEMKAVLNALAHRFGRVEIIGIDRVRSNFTRSTRQMQVRFT